MPSHRWVLTNLRCEVSFAPVPPASRVVLEMLADPGAGGRPPAGLDGGGPAVRLDGRQPSERELHVTVEDAVLNMPEDRLPVRDGLIQAVSWRAAPGGIRINVEMAFAGAARVSWIPGVPARLCLELGRDALVELLSGRRIGIDPGHGGRDAGARGARYREADVMLQIGRMLARWVRDHRGEPVVTRDGDHHVPVEHRLALINRKRPDAYVGLHACAGAGRRRHGTLVLHRGDSASERLARCLHEAILSASPYLADEGVHPSVHPPLSSLSVAAAIVVPEHITHHLGEGLLRASDFQQRIAQSTLDGLAAYLRLTRLRSPGPGIPVHLPTGTPHTVAVPGQAAPPQWARAAPRTRGLSW